MELEVNSVNIARFLSELEGCYIFTKYMGFEDDMNTIDEMKKRYYKLCLLKPSDSADYLQPLDIFVQCLC